MEAALTDHQTTRKHPRGLYLLFITEMWERYSYYGMRAVLVLYLTTALVSGGLGMDPAKAMMLYGFYTGAVYFTPLLGGWLTDRYIGLRTAITIGGITMALGDFTLFALNSQTGVYLGLFLLIMGNGFFKPNISTLVGELYPERNDKRKDAAFTIFYMGINLGAFFAPLVAGYLAEDLFHFTDNDGIEHFGFQYAFLASSIGMIIGQVIFNIFSRKFLGETGTKPLRTQTATPDGKDKPLTAKEKQRTLGLIIVACFVVFFWAGFEQAGSSFTLYTQKFVDRTVFGYEVPTSWFQSINPLFIIILAPILSTIWYKLSNTKGGDLKATTKMAFGMMLLGLGFLVLVPAVLQTGSDEANIGIKANMLFIIVTYLFHTIGELFLSPVGLSLVNKVSPVKIASLMMGVWLFSSAVANFGAGKLAALTESLGYLEIFSVIGIAAIILGIILLLISKKLSVMLFNEEK
jgi:proton-dependent oligopeptide transporter, POT family